MADDKTAGPVAGGVLAMLVGASLAEPATNIRDRYYKNQGVPVDGYRPLPPPAGIVRGSAADPAAIVEINAEEAAALLRQDLGADAPQLPQTATRPDDAAPRR